MRGLAKALPAPLLACALVLGLGRYGLTQDHALYVAFAMLVPAAIISLWAFPAARSKAQIGLAIIGAPLLAHVALRPTDAARGFTVAALGWMALLITVQLAQEPRSARRLYGLLVILGLIEAFFGLAQALGGVDRIFAYERKLGEIATGTFINRNHFAGFANMGLGLVLGWLFAGVARDERSLSSRSESLARSWTLILISSFIGLAVLLSRSRGGALSLAGMLGIVFALLVLRSRRGKGQAGLPAGAVLTLALTIVALAALVGVGGLAERFAETDGLRRPQIYLDTLRLIADHPLTGVGPGQYVWEFRPYQTGSVEFWFNHAHNDYLETAAEWGVPLALLFWAFVLRRLYGAGRLFLTDEVLWRRGMALGCLAAGSAILIHSLVDFNLHIPANLMVFMTILGISWSLEGGARPGTQPEAQSGAQSGARPGARADGPRSAS